MQVYIIVEKMITKAFLFIEIISMFIKAKTINKHYKSQEFDSNNRKIKHGLVTLTMILKFIQKNSEVLDMGKN